METVAKSIKDDLVTNKNLSVEKPIKKIKSRDQRIREKIKLLFGDDPPIQDDLVVNKSESVDKSIKNIQPLIQNSIILNKKETVAKSIKDDLVTNKNESVEKPIQNGIVLNRKDSVAKPIKDDLVKNRKESVEKPAQNGIVLSKNKTAAKSIKDDHVAKKNLSVEKPIKKYTHRDQRMGEKVKFLFDEPPIQNGHVKNKKETVNKLILHDLVQNRKESLKKPINNITNGDQPPIPNGIVKKSVENPITKITNRDQRIREPIKFLVDQPPIQHDRVKTFKILTMSSGKYVHFGVERFLHRIRKMNGIKVQDEEEKVLFIDVAFYVVKPVKMNIGHNLRKYLVILGRPAGKNYNEHCKEPFVIGIYNGLFTSPTTANEILRPFVDEMLSIQHSKFAGIYSVKIRAIICDPIANSLVTCTTHPDSIYGCSKCNGKQQFNSTTSYPDFYTPHNLRSDDDFLQPKQNDHHTGIPILCELKIGLISQTYIDYKHTVCLGVMKRFLELWMYNGKRDYRLSGKSIKDISTELERISNDLPMEFLAAPKPLSSLKNWTAYDYRQFLLYYGPVVLQKHLPQKYYQHFLNLSLALRIMINSDNQIELVAHTCSKRLNDFVAEFSTLYGPDLIDYNVHNLLHLDDLIFNWYKADSVGGFRYDKQMDLITTNILNGVSLENLIPKIEENTNSIMKIKEISSGKKYPYLDSGHNLICRHMVLNKDEPNNYIITMNDEIAIIDEITKIGEVIIIYGRPVISVIMYQANGTMQKMRMMVGKLPQGAYKFDDIKTKAVKISTSSGDYILPLLTP